MRVSSSRYCFVLPIVFAALSAGACQKNRAHMARSVPASDETTMDESARTHDAAWYSRAAVVSVDPGNSVTQRRSESTFSTRTSHASVGSHTSSLLVQVAALNHSVAMKQPLLEQQLRDAGLHVTGQRRSKLHQPNEYNVLVEDVTYVDEADHKNGHDVATYTIVPAVHVRVISANERATLEGKPIPVRLYSGSLSADAADMYGKKLAGARAELGRQLVHWLQPRLRLAQSHVPTPETAKPQAIAHNSAAKR